MLNLMLMLIPDIVHFIQNNRNLVSLDEDFRYWNVSQFFIWNYLKQYQNSAIKMSTLLIMIIMVIELLGICL